MKTIKPAKIISVFIVGLSCLSETYAQNFTSAATIELGGSVLLSAQKADNGDALNTFIFNPYVGVMMGRGFELGIIPAYISQTEDSYTRSSVGLYLAPAINIHSGGDAYLFLEFLFGYNVLNEEEYNRSSEKGIAWGVDAGVKFNASTHSLILLQVQFLNQNFKSDAESDYSTFNILSLGAGFRVFIPSKTKTKK